MTHDPPMNIGCMYEICIYIDLFQNILYVVHKEEKLNSIFIIVEYIRIVWVPDSPWMKMNNLA